jgi:hypothetical protein
MCMVHEEELRTKNERHLLTLAERGKIERSDSLTALPPQVRVETEHGRPAVLHNGGHACFEPAGFAACHLNILWRCGVPK